MPERHVKISYADTSALFSERHVKCLGDIFSRKILRDMFRCLGDILTFFSGKMSVRNVKILPCLWGILFFVQAKCLRDMLRCRGDMSRLLGVFFIFQVRCLERHRASNFQQFPGKNSLTCFCRPTVANFSKDNLQTILRCPRHLVWTSATCFGKCFAISSRPNC